MWDASIDTIAPLNPSSEEVTMALVNLPTFGSRLNTCKMSGGGSPSHHCYFRSARRVLMAQPHFAEGERVSHAGSNVPQCRSQRRWKSGEGTPAGITLK